MSKYNVMDLFSGVGGLSYGFSKIPDFNILAAKILKKDFKFIAIVSVLSVTNSLFWYRWALKYGTLGFITSTSLAPLVFVLASKLLSKNENLSKNEAILLVVTTSLLLLWSAAGLIFIPCILLGIIFLNRLLKKKYVCKIILSLMLINIPWIIIFFSASNVGNFIKAEKSTELVNIETKINRLLLRCQLHPTGYSSTTIFFCLSLQTKKCLQNNQKVFAVCAPPTVIGM